MRLAAFLIVALAATPGLADYRAVMTALPGVGGQLARLFERVAGTLVVDLVWHLPSGLVDRPSGARHVRERLPKPTHKDVPPLTPRAQPGEA